jgi:hypothetical protein
VAFARRGFKENDAYSLVYLGTFLALDAHGTEQPADWQLAQAKELWHEASRLEEKNPFLAKELGIDLSSAPQHREGDGKRAEDR